MSKTAKNLLITIAIIGIVVLLAWPKMKVLWQDEAKAAGGGPGGKKGGPIPVSGVIIKNDTLNKSISVAGNVLADESVDLKSEVSGRIIKINFKEGSKVQKGQLLVKINDADLQAELKKLLSQKNVIVEREKRQKQLLEKEAVSREEYEAAAYEVSAINANIELLHAQIAKTSIVAPFDGTIGLKDISEGSYVSPADRIASLVKINPVKIDFSVPERYANAVKLGSEVTFNLQGGTDDYKAKVYAVEPRIEFNTRGLQVRALYPNSKNELYPGSFVQIKLALEKIDDAQLIPSEALIPDAKGPMVYLYKAGKAAPQPIEAGIRTDDQVQVKSGLNPGDTLITSGIINLKPGAPVNLEIKVE